LTEGRREERIKSIGYRSAFLASVICTQTIWISDIDSISTDYSQVDARFSHGIDESVEIEGIGDMSRRKILSTIAPSFTCGAGGAQ
jgi:hypothetical protein